MSLSGNLSSYVSPTIRERGQEYFRLGRVSLQNVNSRDVYAIVRGSDTYDVDLELDDRVVYANCTCPYIDEFGAVCKHIWATILAAESRGFGASTQPPLRLVLDEFADDDDEFDDGPLVFNVSPLAPKPAPAPRRDNWKQHLEQLSRDSQPVQDSYSRTRPVERQLVFVVDHQASDQARELVLEVQIQERKKNGDWSKPKAQSLSASQIAELPNPLDRRLLALLGGAQRGETYGYGYSYYGNSYGYAMYRYRLSGLLLETVLPLLAESGRVFLRRPVNPPALEELVADLDPPWELTVGVNRDQQNKNWVIAGSVRRGDETLHVSAATLLVPGMIFWSGRFGRLNDRGAFAWVPTLRRVGTITVPISRGDELLDQLLQMPKLPQLDLPEELRFTEEHVIPKPRVVVKSAKQNYGQRFLQVELSFAYGDQIVPAKSTSRGVFQADSKHFLLRNPDAEKAASQELTRLGVRQAYSYRDHVLELKPTLLPKLVRDLTTAGWHVEAEGKLYRQPGAFHLAVRSGQDWFDLSAKADFDGKPVPLPQLLAAMEKGESTVVLDDGSLGMVPEEWLKKYGLLARIGTVEGDNVRFGRTQVGVLDALIASRPEVEYDKQFARARQELSKFEGVAPADPTKAFKGELRGYQREGLGWLRFLRKFGFGGCLADDMGLGKTVQVLALLTGKRSGPALIVVPRSLIFNWKEEAAKFTPKLKVLDHTGTSRDRTGESFKGHDIVLTTYGTLRNDAAMFAETRFDTCVLDESQAAKNAETETAKAVRLVQADHRLALSGTPVENHLGELWTLFDFLNPGMLGRTVPSGSGSASIRTPDAETREFLARALRPFILRRTKDQVAKDLPAKTEQTVYCDLETAQRKLYDELRNHYRQSLLSRVDSLGLGRSKFQVLEALLRLRQAACHPGLLDKSKASHTSAKLDYLMPHLTELAEGGSKVLVFSQFTSLLGIVRTRLDAEKLKYEYLDGKTRDRAARVERFQTDPKCKLFLVSLKAGGVGLNLTAAEYVFLLDPWWNPAVEAQAIDRTHRIGQTKPVFAYRLIARGTVEEKVLALQQSKRALADAIIGGDGSLITDLKREDLELLLS